MNKIFAPFLPPWAETGLQPAFYDVESGTVLQQTARMYDKVNQLIRLFNEFSESVSAEINAFEKDVNDVVDEYIQKFVELKDYVEDYFANLDVQEEINNKLDVMAEDGTLTDIIAQYLTLAGVLAFSNVSELAAAENLAMGSKAKTYGYLRQGDGVYDLYTIREKEISDVADGYNLVELTNAPTLIAERLQTGRTSVINLLGSDDITAYLELPIAKKIVLPYNTTYTVTDHVFLNSDTEVDLNSSILYFYYDTDDDHETNYFAYKTDDTFTLYNGNKNITFRNGKIKGGCGVYMHCQNVLYENVEFIDIHSRHCLQIASCSNFVIRGCKFYGTIPANDYGSECINIDPCNWGGQPALDPSSVMYDHNNNYNIVIENNKFNMATTEGLRYSNAIGSHGADDANQLICDGLVIKDNDFTCPYYSVLNICDYKNVHVSNNIATFVEVDASTQSKFIYIRGAVENAIVDSNTIKQCHQLIYTSNDKRERKNITVSNNIFDAIDNQGSAAFQVTFCSNLNIINNKIDGRYRFLHTDCIYDNDVPDTATKCDGVTLAQNSVTMIRDSDVCLRVRQTENIDIDGNTFRNPNGRTENFCAIQTGVVNCVIRNNDIDTIYKFMTPASFSDELFMTNNNWLYTLTSEFAGGSLTKTGTLWKPINKFSRLYIQLGGGTSNTSSVEVIPYYPDTGNKFTTADRTWRFPIAKWDNSLGYVNFSIADGDQWSYTGDVDIRQIIGKD